MKKIFVCSPLSGKTTQEVFNNITNAKNYCRMITNSGHLPIAPHTYFPQFLDDSKPKERDLGIKMGLELMQHCDEMWVFSFEDGHGNLKLSEGMKKEIEAWGKLGKGDATVFHGTNYESIIYVLERYLE